MRHLRTFLLWGPLLAVASGCSTTQYVRLPDLSVEVEDPKLARIYVVRPDRAGVFDPGSVSDGETLVGVLGAQRFLCWEREPGELEILWNVDDPGLEEDDIVPRILLNVEAGRVYYVTVTPGGPLGMRFWRIDLLGRPPPHLWNMSPPEPSSE
jgi:hypothetical protein